MPPQSPLADHKVAAQPHLLSQQRGGSPSTKAARASLAKNTINTVIPHILQHNTRARLGNASTEPISYSPYLMSIKAGVRSKIDAKYEDEGVKGGNGQGKEREKGERAPSKSIPSKKGKITGFFKVLPKVKKNSDEDGEFVHSKKDGEAISKQDSISKKSDANADTNDSTSSPRKDTPIPTSTSTSTTSPHFSPTPTPTIPLVSSPPIPSSSSSSLPPKLFPKVTVIQSDTLNAAEIFVDPTAKNRRIAVLNMASFLRPGGGVIQGAIAQEESLCLRSTLYTSLDEKYYRLPKFGGLFTEDILVSFSFISSLSFFMTATTSCGEGN